MREVRSRKRCRPLWLLAIAAPACVLPAFAQAPVNTNPPPAPKPAVVQTNAPVAATPSPQPKTNQPAAPNPAPWATNAAVQAVLADAEKGNAVAQFKVGMLFLNGSSVSRNLSLCAVWLKS